MTTTTTTTPATALAEERAAINAYEEVRTELLREDLAPGERLELTQKLDAVQKAAIAATKRRAKAESDARVSAVPALAELAKRADHAAAIAALEPLAVRVAKAEATIAAARAEARAIIDNQAEAAREGARIARQHGHAFDLGPLPLVFQGMRLRAAIEIGTEKLTEERVLRTVEASGLAPFRQFQRWSAAEQLEALASGTYAAHQAEINREAAVAVRAEREAYALAERAHHEAKAAKQRAAELDKFAEKAHADGRMERARELEAEASALRVRFAELKPTAERAVGAYGAL